MEKNNIHTDRLFKFMSLFRISRFKILSVDDKTIKAQVGWADDEEESQDILWHIQDNDSMEDALTLGKTIYDNKLLSNDKIIVDYEILQGKINWPSKKFEAALDTLLSIKVNMLDDGEETDIFFIHF